MAEPPDPRAQLDVLVVRATRQLRGWAWRRALEEAAPILFPGALVVPAVMLPAAVAHALGAPAWWPFGALPSIALALSAPLLAVATRALWLISERRTERARCLALYDYRLRLRDRLQTADELLRRGATGGFARAAIEDAAAAIAQALTAPPPAVTPAPPKWSMTRWPLGAIAAAAMLAALFINGRALALAGNTAKPPVAAPAATATTPPEEPTRRGTDQHRDELDLPSAASLAAATRLAPSARRVERSQAAPAGSRASGSQADADARGGNDSQAGAAAGGAAGASGTEPPDKPKVAGDKPRRTRAPQREAVRQPVDATSGVAAGKGGSSGSQVAASHHPAAANRADADDVDNDVKDLAEEEEDEAQQAASSHRPMLNNRKAPVDRSLMPAATSDRERDELNGRGRPGGLKKTRGVAAMLLGVPAPDHLRGNANPGRMKVRRERSEPEAKHVGLANAAARGARQTPFGAIAHPRLRPWMQDMVRDYFLARNQPPSPPPDENQP